MQGLHRWGDVELQERDSKAGGQGLSFDFMTQGVERWTYKSKAEIEALSDEQLLKVHKELFDAVKAFWDHGVKMTDEMFWQFCVVPDVVRKRGLKK